MNKFFAVVLLLLIPSASVWSDDISAVAPKQGKPNVLLVLDYSNSMHGRLGGIRKINSLKDVITQVISEYSKEVNIGLGPMFHQEAGGILWPISDLDLQASLIDPDITDPNISALDVVTDMINDTGLQFGTASVPALIEAAQYFTGGPVQIGGADPRNVRRFKPNTWQPSSGNYEGGDKLAAHSASYTPSNAYQSGGAPGSTGICKRYPSSYGPDFCEGLAVTSCSAVRGPWSHVQCEYTHSDLWLNPTYNSPITQECQANFIVFVSDGKPHDIGNREGFESVTGMEFRDCDDLGRLGGGGRTGNCGPELTSYLYNTDLNSSFRGSNVITHSVAFGVTDWGADYLQRLADFGGGSFFNAGGSEELSAALGEIFGDIASSVDSISEFSIDVDRFSVSHDDRMYMPLILPSGDKSWRGNVKGYFVDDGGIKDLTGAVATEYTADGLVFKEDARSFWSRPNDGKNVQRGGVAENLDPALRSLYTYVGREEDIPVNGVRLAGSDDHLLDRSNPNLVAPLFGRARNHRLLLDEIRAMSMGDPLHSDVVIANYSGDKRVIFSSTNQGFLHAFDVTEPRSSDYNNGEGGEELFAFMPKELLPNLLPLVTGDSTEEHIYGLDGNITPWHNDDNGDGIVNGRDTLMLVFGMRRGGQNYYAMDVTNPSDPRLMWQISGGAGLYTKLAQTWSRPSLVSVKHGPDQKKVLIFGGGYDGRLDDIHSSTVSMGGSIFVVDEDGDLLWSASHPKMEHSIPSDLTVIDTDQDGLADRVYVGDLGGQIWRVDFDDVTNSREYEVSLLADLSDDGYRPFYYPPSVSLEKNGNGRDYLAVAIGSGNRDNPIADRTRQGLYMIMDRNIETAASATSVKLFDLYDATAGDLQSTIASVAQNAKDTLAAKEGWVIQLDIGDKIINEVLTLNSNVIATVYKSLSAGSSDYCAPPSSLNRVMGISINDVAPSNFLTSSSTPTLSPANRYMDLSAGGIASKPQLVFSKNSGDVQLFVGKEQVTSIPSQIEKLLWYEKQ